jgi:hypothetical protein
MIKYRRFEPENQKQNQFPLSFFAMKYRGKWKAGSEGS